ncbi:MAG: BNR repeat-containing protein [Pirellulales bacterium]|nr:BNR repeat-containing protein [Pirellulales bacterium]
MKIIPATIRSASAIIVGLALSAAATCRAAADPADYLKIVPIRAAGSTANELGYAKSKINAVSFKQQSLTTIDTPRGGKYQFASYYAGNRKLVVGRRKMLALGWSDWYLRRTAFTSYNINDNHNVSSIGIGGDGILHISWGMHCNPLLYTRSAASVLGDEPFTLIGDEVGNRAGLGTELTASKSVTYPLFYNLPYGGDLLFSYRIGDSGNGNLQLRRWSVAEKIWKPVHAGTSPLFKGDYARPNVNGYTNYAAFDPQGKWHLTWSWRTGGDSKSGFKDYQTNHHLLYAWSPNQGVDWYRNDGARYERSGKHAIDESNASPVVAIPEGSSLINQAHMAAGPNGKVYVATWWAPKAAQGDHLRQFMLAWKDGDAWKVSQIGSRKPENADVRGVSQRVSERELQNFRITRPIVMVDETDRVIVGFTDWQRGRKFSIAHSEDPARKDWKFIDLPTEDLGTWEASLDLNRWQKDGVMSLLYQPTQLGQDSSEMAVLEWDARGYFAGRKAALAPRSAVPRGFTGFPSSTKPIPPMVP